MCRSDAAQETKRFFLSFSSPSPMLKKCMKNDRNSRALVLHDDDGGIWFFFLFNKGDFLMFLEMVESFLCSIFLQVKCFDDYFS